MKTIKTVVGIKPADILPFLKHLVGDCKSVADWANNDWAYAFSIKSIPNCLGHPKITASYHSASGWLTISKY